MAAITLAQAQEDLEAARAAYLAALGKRGYSIGTRQMQMQDIDKLRNEYERCQAVVNQLSRGSSGIRIRGGTPT